MNLDHYDKQILYELDKDASISLAKLSKLLKRSKPFILHRINRLEKDTITSYHAIIDFSKLGYFTFRIYLDLQNYLEEDKEKIIHYAKKHSQVWSIATMSGGWDLALYLSVQNIIDFHKVWDDMKLHFKDQLKKYSISLYAPIYNYNKIFFLDKPILNQERVYGIGETEQIDEVDKKILRIHGSFSRKSSVEISQEIKVSSDTVRTRIKKLLKKKIIVGYKIGLDLGKLNHESYIVELDLNDTSKENQLRRFCNMHPAIYQVNKTIGGADFEFEIIVKNTAELVKVIDEMKKKFKDIILDDNYFRFSRSYLVNNVL